MRGPRNTQMVFAALARGKKNKKLTVLTIDKRNNHPPFRNIVSVAFQLIAHCCMIQKVDFGSVKIVLDVCRRKRSNHAS